MKTALMIAFIFMGHPYNIELALTPMEQATGLMYRQNWTDDSQGMLFVNRVPRRVSFWMKNTYLDMTIFYLDKDFNILEIHYPVPLDETPMTSKTDRVQYVLELNPDLEDQVTASWAGFASQLQSGLENKKENIAVYQH